MDKDNWKLTTKSKKNNGSRVILEVFNLLSWELTTLIDEEKEAGYHSVDFNASDLPSGVYFYQLKAVDPSTSSEQSLIETKKMILLK